MRSFIIAAVVGIASAAEIPEYPDIFKFGGAASKPTQHYPSQPSYGYPHPAPHTYEDPFQQCKDDIAELQGTVDELSGQVAALTSLVATVQGGNQVLSDWLNTKAPQVIQNASDIAGIKVRVGANETAILDLK
jgi:trimeric autotransporter adhesin